MGEGWLLSPHAKKKSCREVLCSSTWRFKASFSPASEPCCAALVVQGDPVAPAGTGFFNLRKSLLGWQPGCTEQKAALDREWQSHKGFQSHVAFPICNAGQSKILCQREERPGSKTACQDCCSGAGPAACWCLVGTASRLRLLVPSLMNPLDKSPESKLHLTPANYSKLRASLSSAEVECWVKW